MAAGPARAADTPAPGPGSIDPVTFEVLKNAVDSILDEMSLTIVRTAYSTIIRDAMDFATSFFDADGQLLAQGLSIPFHLGAMPDALAAVRRRYGDELRPGDVFILNDPFDGGSHLQDFFLFRPVFVEGTLAGFTAASAHQTDVGGRVPGSNASDSTEIYQEGLRIPPMRLYDAGRPVQDLFRIVEANVRVPDKVFGDVRAQLTATQIGEKRFRELVDRHGLPTILAYFREVLDYTERVTRAEIAALPDGRFEFTDYLDDDGFDPDLVPIRIAITVVGDEMTIDMTGSAPQVRGAINSTASFSKSSAYLALRGIFASHVPNNAGFFRPIKFVMPEASIVNLALPAPCAARAITGFRVADAVLGALAQAVPERVMAAGEGGNAFVTLAGRYAGGRPYILVQPWVGAWGGRSDRDGLDGAAPLASNSRNAPVERLEAEYPIRMERWELLADSGGPGRFRGGMSVVYDTRLLSGEALLQVRSDRRKVLPYGLFGGGPGHPSENAIWSAEGRRRALPSKFIATLREGELYRHVVPSGGGYGDPLEREPERVLADVRQGKVSVGRARRDYGVVVRGRGRAARLDPAATDACRAELRRARGAS